MNIYSAKFMNEATASLSSKVFKNQADETYLFSAMNILREMNTIINESTKQMYIQIAEAESKSDENKIFANYFYQFRQIFSDFSNKINEMKSRMIMTVENKVETWDDLIKDDSYISSFEEEFNYSGYKFSHIEDDNYPKLNLYKMYQKEFDYLGQLMQDNNGIDASSTAKLKIIASVSNNFAKSGADKHWIKHLMEEMLDVDDDEFEHSYSECIYKSLRKKEDITVNKSVLYSCKEKLIDYTDAIDAAIKLCDNLLLEVEKVANDISSYLFRNQDNKLKIKTDTDGVINRDYRLDTYAMNQLDLFMNNKINQIRKVLNVYCAAIGIKFDTVVDYISQNIEILNTARNYYNGTIELPMDDSTKDDTEENMEEEPEEDGSDDEPEEGMENDASTDDMEEVPEEDENKEPIEEEPDEDMEEEEPEEDMEEDESELSLDMESDNFEESYLFESELFEIEMMMENTYMHEEVVKALMLEEDQPNNANNQTLTNVQKTADKLSGWQNLVQKLANLWKKFKELLTTNATPKIEYLKKNGKFLETDLKNEVKLRFTPDINKLQSIKIPDLTNDSLKYLDSEDNFVSHYFGDFKPANKEETLPQNIKNRVLGKEQSGPANALSIKIMDAYNFCINYPANTNQIRTQTEAIEKAQRVAKDFTKVEIGESASNNDFMQYFSEMEEVKQPGDNNNQQNNAGTKQNTDNSKKVTLYFKVCSQVLAAEMTCYQSLFNEFYSFCKWWIKTVSGSTGNKSNGTKSAQKTDDTIKMN